MKAIKPSRQQVRFIIAGMANVFITNVVLQTLLISNIFSIALSTFASQLINSCLGYFLYGKFVFKTKFLFRKKQIIHYLLIMSSMWFINTYVIIIGQQLGFSKNLVALSLIPLLTALSYLCNRSIFKNYTV